MRLIQVYKCLCDETRLRILQLLTVSPLCVCHIQSVLGKPQVVISQHLSYLKNHGLAGAQRHQQWMIYSLPETPSAELAANLKCLQDCATTDPVFAKDRARLRKLMGNKNVAALLATGCCPARSRRIPASKVRN